MRTTMILAVAALTLAALPAAPSVAATRSPAPVRFDRGQRGIRPFIGAAGDLKAGVTATVGGNKFIFGADLELGEETGLAYLVGLHLGTGDNTFLLQPLVEVHWRFDLGMPLVPWVGGGAGVKLGFGSFQATNLALSFRVSFGAEYFVSRTVAVGTQLVIPDIGPRLLPSLTTVGTVEWIIGPHIRF